MRFGCNFVLRKVGFLFCVLRANAFLRHGRSPPTPGHVLAVDSPTRVNFLTGSSSLKRTTSTLIHSSREREEEPKEKLSSDIRRAFLASAATAVTFNVVGALATPPGFKRIPTQFIAALGDPNASSGTGADSWGLWSVDPGPRGIPLEKYSQLEASSGKTAAGWMFDKNDWWLEEHGLIMEKPRIPLTPGRYLVTGGRLVTTVLTIYPEEVSGHNRKWSLEYGKLYDVTHLPCRAARYRPISVEGSPAMAYKNDFPVVPGAAMPIVEGCDKKDYAVLFVIGLESSSA